MKVFYNTEDAMGQLKKTVVTTGSFDGVHIGHKTIIDRLNELANNIEGESTLVTFHPHPRKVLYPQQTDLKLINSQEEKIELLSKTKLDNLIIIPFTVEFSKTTSHNFITQILIGQLKAKIIVVGQNHHFGHNRTGDFTYLDELSEQMGFQLEDIPLKDIENETVSSTKIRKALMEGNIMRANAYLDHQYIMTGIMDKAYSVQELSNKSLQRINLPEEEKLIPPSGIYATNLFVEGDFLKSMTIIKHSLHDGSVIENLLIHDDRDLTNKKATLYFYKKIKGIETSSENGIKIQEVQEAIEEIEELIY